ncbi:hypothetical protein KQX54_008603 [Cotesia glomerata]|uniref:Uncharacterized protein n=1 Tax=Cotesia glomerata TaxID=32391 RepID=A0AAV7IKU9_COTGL|nr:hypothetical protein KQX54_008603 [Cotesia glomerata]
MIAYNSWVTRSGQECAIASLRKPAQRNAQYLHIHVNGERREKSCVVRRLMPLLLLCSQWLPLPAAKLS